MHTTSPLWRSAPSFQTWKAERQLIGRANGLNHAIGCGRNEGTCSKADHLGLCPYVLGASLPALRAYMTMTVYLHLVAAPTCAPSLLHLACGEEQSLWLYDAGRGVSGRGMMDASGP